MPLITMKACPTTSTSPTNATAFDSGKGPAPRIRNCTARTGPKKGITAPVARFQVNPAATASATRSPMRRWRDSATAAAETSAGISQDGDEANKYRTQSVRDWIVAGVDDDIHLRTEPHAAPRRRLVDDQTHRETLRVAHPARGVFDRWQAGIGINAILGDAPAYAFDVGFEDRAWQRVEYQFGPIGRRHVFEAILLEIRRNPDRAQVDEGKGGLPCPYELAGRKLEIGDQSVGRGLDPCVKKIEPRTLQRRKRRLELRIVSTLRAKLFPRLGEVRLARCQHRPCGVPCGAGCIGLGSGVDAPFDKFENPLRLGLNVLEFGGLLHDLRLCRVHGGRRGSQRLTDLLDLGLRLSHGKFEGARINAEQDLTCVDASIVGDVDAYDTDRDFGRPAQRVRRVGVHAIGLRRSALLHRSFVDGFRLRAHRGNRRLAARAPMPASWNLSAPTAKVAFYAARSVDCGPLWARRSRIHSMSST